MPVLTVSMQDAHLQLTLDDLTATVPWDAATTLRLTDAAFVKADPVKYGQDLFEHVFSDNSIRGHLLELPSRTVLQLVDANASLDGVAWEYLRDSEGELLAGRLALTRSLPNSKRQAGDKLPNQVQNASGVNVLAITSAPVNQTNHLDVEQEWQYLVEAIHDTSRQVTVKRIRPPTLSRLEQDLKSGFMTIVQFMGHSRVSLDGKTVLEFEDELSQSYPVSGAKFADSLDDSVALVILSSCHSGTGLSVTRFGNVACSLVKSGIPYAIGMQFELPDLAAIELTRVFYTHLFNGRSIEESVLRSRRHLLDQTRLGDVRAWIAGIPVLYTSYGLNDAPLDFSQILPPGKPRIVPDPDLLAVNCNLTQLPPSTHFVGRDDKIGEVLSALQTNSEDSFVVIQGLGGIGKTALARAVAERIGYRYSDKVLAISFERFLQPTHTHAHVDTGFVDRLYRDLTRFYYGNTIANSEKAELRQLLLLARQQGRSLLILDNLDTLLDALGHKNPLAQEIANLICELRTGKGGILVTSRYALPPDWGGSHIVELRGLSDVAGSQLFLQLLPSHTKRNISTAALQKLSQRVEGHPLAIRLLAGQLGKVGLTLEDFLKDFEQQLAGAELNTPLGYEDPDRQRTLFACMAYSVNRLTKDEQVLLRIIAVFRSPVHTHFVTKLLCAYTQTSNATSAEIGELLNTREPGYEDVSNQLQRLAGMGLVTKTVSNFQDGPLELFSLHPALKFYVKRYMPGLPESVLTVYDTLYTELLHAPSTLESPRARHLIRSSTPEYETISERLSEEKRNALLSELYSMYDRMLSTFPSEELLIDSDSKLSEMYPKFERFAP